MISTDEKASIQARCRCHPSLPPGPRQPMGIAREYDRRGALACLAALDVHHARVLGRCEDTSGIVPFSRLVEQVMTTELDASARRVFFVADNGSSHRGQASVNRMAKAWPTAKLVHLPIHASWLNQTVLFSIIQRKILTPNDLPRPRRRRSPPPHPSRTSLEVRRARDLGRRSRVDELLARFRWL